jgi:hypothetical protein
MFAQALAMIHPNHRQLLSEVQRAGQRGLSSAASAPVPDATVEGYQYVMDGLLKRRGGKL